MKTKDKGLLISCAVAVALVLGYTGVQLTARFRAYQVEDRIADTFGPVATAIDTYGSQNGSPPSSLASMIPKYLQQIPRSPYADSITYTSLPNNKWILEVHSSTLAPSRVYSWRSEKELTHDERIRLIKEFHSCIVLRDKGEMGSTLGSWVNMYTAFNRNKHQ